MRARSFSLVASFSLLIACGGGSPPSAPAPISPEAGAESFSEVNPADLAELDAGAAAPAKSGDPKAPGSEASASGGTAPTNLSPEPKDECTPIGVDFEKRARASLKACYAEGKKKDANLQGTVRITIDIDTLGKVKSIKVTEKTLPDPVANCMLKVVKTTPLAPADAAKCPGRALTIPMTFPTPH
jgi:hypothetical protein